MSASTMPAGSRPAAVEQEGGIPYKWLVVIAVVFGVFMSVLDTTVINIALGKLQAVFGASLATIQWVITAYTLALTVSIPLFGYLADRFGAKPIYLISLGIFTIASALCGLAWSSTTIIIFRILQGLGGGALLPLAISQIYAVFPPEERGRSSAAIGIPVLLAPALGPTLGGYLIQYADWRLIFYINVPIGVIGLVVGTLVLRRGRFDPRAKLDWPGLILSSAGFATLIYGISDAADDGWGSTKVIAYIAVGIICLIGLVFVELRADAPLLDMRLFKDWAFTGGVLITSTLQVGLFGALFLLPVFLESLRGLNALQTGIVLLPSALATVAVLPPAGILVDRIGPKWVIVIGLVALTIASYELSHITISTPLLLLQIWLLGRSVAIGFTVQPAQVAALANVPPQALARASALYNVLRQVAVAFGTSFLATYVGNQRPVHVAYLAERLTPLSPAAQLVGQVIARAQANGSDVGLARAQVVGQIVGQVQREASVLAFKDAFLLVAVISVVGTVIALFLGRTERRSGEAPMIME